MLKCTYRMKNMLKVVLEAGIHHLLELMRNLLIELHVLTVEQLCPNVLDHIQCQQIPQPIGLNQY